VEVVVLCEVYRLGEIPAVAYLAMHSDGLPPFQLAEFLLVEQRIVGQILFGGLNGAVLIRRVTDGFIPILTSLNLGFIVSERLENIVLGLLGQLHWPCRQHLLYFLAGTVVRLSTFQGPACSQLCQLLRSRVQLLGPRRRKDSLSTLEDAVLSQRVAVHWSALELLVALPALRKQGLIPDKRVAQVELIRGRGKC